MSFLGKISNGIKKGLVVAGGITVEHIAPIALDAVLPPGLDNVAIGLIDKAWDSAFKEAEQSDGTVDQAVLKALIKKKILAELAEQGSGNTGFIMAMATGGLVIGVVGTCAVMGVDTWKLLAWWPLVPVSIWSWCCGLMASEDDKES